MIQGAINGRGGAALARHLTCTDENEILAVLPARNMVADNMFKQLRELEARSAHGRTTKPIHHLHVDPETQWSDAQYARHLELYEHEFGLTDQPRLAVFHSKHGRGHRHYVYTLVRRDGSTIRMSHDYARREKISRILEYEFGEPHVVGKHNRAVAAALREDGRLDVAASMEAAGLLDAERPVAAISPAERQQQQRTGVEKLRIEKIVLAAWQDTAEGASFERAIEARGLSLAIGEKVPVVVDRTGNVHPLARMIGKASKAATGVRIMAAEVRARLGAMILRPLADIVLETRLMPLMADLEDITGPGDGTGRDEPCVMQSAAEGADTLMVDEIAAILDVIERDDPDPLSAATDVADIDGVAQLLTGIETITGTVAPDEAEVDGIAACLDDVGRLSLDELDDMPDIGLRTAKPRHAPATDNALGGRPRHSADNAANDNTVEEVAAILEAVERDDPDALPAVSDIDAVAELVADIETIIGMVESDHADVDGIVALVTGIADLIAAIDTLTITDIHGLPPGQGLAVNTDVPAIGGMNGIDRFFPPAHEPDQHQKEKTNAKRIFTSQNADAFRNGGSKDASDSYPAPSRTGPGRDGRVQRDAPEDAPHRNADGPDRGPSFGRPDHGQKGRRKNPDSASRTDRQEPGFDYQPCRGDSSAPGTPGSGNARPRPAKPVTTGARPTPKVVRPPPRPSLWRQAITKIGGGLSRLVSTAGLMSTSTQPSTIPDAAKRNVGRAYKQDARALGANHPRAKPVRVEPTTAEQVARNAPPVTSPVTRTPEQVPPQRRVVDRVPTLPAVRPVPGDRGATMLGSPPPSQVPSEAPKLPADVIMKFVPTIMPTAPCQEQRSEGEPQTNDDMPAPWK